MKRRSVSSIVMSIIAALVFIGVSLPVQPVSAFGTSIHEQITSYALQSKGFSAWALSELADWADHPDYWHTFESAAHFDNCAWTEGTNWIASYRSAAVGAAYNYWLYNNTSYRDDAYEYLGHVFHTAQDFYSHSNWIETHSPNVTANLWGSKPGGWYSGTFWASWPHNCPSGTPDHSTLNKDDASRPGYAEAWWDAHYATQREWTYFENAVRAAYGTTTGNSILAKLKAG